MRKLLIIKQLSLTFFCAIFIQIAYSQENYLAGYIVLLNGDTLHGMVDYRNWEKNPDKISYKENINGDKVMYTPLSIKSFGVKDEIYQSAIIETEISPDITNNLEYNNNLNIKTDTTFLQSMIAGPKSLFYYKNKTGKVLYYIGQNANFELLIYKRYFKHENEGYVVAENKRYLGQLAVYLNDCPTIQSAFTNMDYNKSKLENLFQNYYKITHTGIKFQKKTEKTTYEHGILAGMTMTSVILSSNSPVYDYFEHANFKPSVNFSTGLFFNIILARNQKKFSIYSELNFSSYKVNGQFDVYDPYNPTEKYKLTSTQIGYSYLKMVNMVRYKYPVGSLKVFVNAGITNGFAIGETNYKKEVSHFYTDNTTKESKAYESPRKYEQGWVFGFGAQLKKLSFEFRYEKGNGMSRLDLLTSTTKRYFFLFGYTL